MTKRFWMFAIQHREAIGGMWEFDSFYDNLEDAIKKAKTMTWPDLIHIVDVQDCKVVWSDTEDGEDDLNEHIQERI